MNVVKKALIVLLVVAILVVFGAGGYAVYKLGPLAPLSKHSRPITIAQQTPNHVYSKQNTPANAVTNLSEDNTQPISVQQMARTSTTINTGKSDDTPAQLPPQVSAQQLQPPVDSAQSVAGQVRGLVKTVLQKTTSLPQTKTENLPNQFSL